MTTQASKEHEHEYDGITELDNQLPKWWLLLFYFTIAFGVVYFSYYHVAKKGKLPRELYAEEMAAAAMPDIIETAQPGGDDNPGGETATPAAPAFTVLEEPSAEASVLAEGKKIFSTHCFACHAQDGGGLVGPNLTDDYFIHGPTYADSMRTVIIGVPEKGMISWKTMLKPDQIHAVCSYIWNLRGTTPATPKAPEGTQHKADS
jgi:cytochrome c oxidase cbb3-type subunit 3